jgi:hypothetical protein
VVIQDPGVIGPQNQLSSPQTGSFENTFALSGYKPFILKPQETLLRRLKNIRFPNAKNRFGGTD